MVDSISRIQFLLMHSLSAGSSSSEEENAVTEGEKVNVEGEDEAQGMSMTKSVSSRSSSGSSPCMHNLRGSHSLMGDEESSDSALPMFLFFNSISQRLAGNSLLTRELGGFENDNDDDDDG